MIQRVEFKTTCAATDSLQAKLNKDVQEIRHDKNIYVKADKTTNHYKRVLMGVPNYQLTTNFSANCQLTTIFLANCQLTTNFSYLVIFIVSQR